MQIEPTKTSLGHAATAKQPIPPKAGVEDAAANRAATALRTALDATPAVRPEEVARARALLADGSYPNDETLQKVAGLLADHLAGRE